MGRASTKRKRKADRAAMAVLTKQARKVVTGMTRAQAQPDAVADISSLTVSVRDVEEAGTASEALRWFVARCEPMAERKVIDGLRERRISAYSPIEKRYRWSRGRKTLDARPLFVGYLFVALTPKQSLYDVCRISGVESIVETTGSKPAQVDGWVILQIACAEVLGLFDHTKRSGPVYVPGQSVAVTGGQFVGHSAKVVDASESKVRLMLEGIFAGGVTIPLDQVEAVDEQKAA